MVTARSEFNALSAKSEGVFGGKSSNPLFEKLELKRILVIHRKLLSTKLATCWNHLLEIYI
jgi:hypothetical protein